MSSEREIVMRLFEGKEDVVYLKDIIDTWNLLDKYNINDYKIVKRKVAISKKDYQKLVGSVKNTRYLKNLVV